MGDIADMMLDGTLDSETGEYIGDQNLKKYGSESPGFPITLSGEQKSKEAERRAQRDRALRQYKVQCPICQKKVKCIGLWTHMTEVHK